MIDHDKVVGALLDQLDQLGIADDTIVVYSTDNAPHMNSWPDAAMTPLRSEKNSNWEGAFRVPELIRWPGRIPAGVVSNEIIQHHDWLPTFLAAAGAPDVGDQLKQGHVIGDSTYRVHIDGFNLLPYLTGEVDRSPRQISSTSPTTATSWRCASTTGRGCSWSSGRRGRCWSGRSRSCRYACRRSTTCADPYERADITSNTYYDWMLDNAYLVKKFPPRQKAASFTIDQAVAKLEMALTAGQ
jgi:arylsulfatase